jgi:hypothetical protein
MILWMIPHLPLLIPTVPQKALLDKHIVALQWIMVRVMMAHLSLFLRNLNYAFLNETVHYLSTTRRKTP